MIIALLFISGCAKKTKRVRLPSAPRIGSIETGIASWYGVPYHGRRAANGEIYDMEKLTAAHRTLPFGTWVEVLNEDNGRSVTVRITDRGPFVDDRIIDLSKAAAREIAMIGPGLAHVRLKIVTAPPEFAAVVPKFVVQVGAPTDRRDADLLKKKFEPDYGEVRVVMRTGNPIRWRVLVGVPMTMEEARDLRAKIRATGADCFVVAADE